MKKYFEGNSTLQDLREGNSTLQDLRESVLRIQKNEDRRGLYIFISLITAILVTTIVGVVLVLNKKKYDEYDEDWDCDWDDEDDDCYFDCEDDGCCTDKDIDTSAKVEKI